MGTLARTGRSMGTPGTTARRPSRCRSEGARATGRRKVVAATVSRTGRTTGRAGATRSRVGIDP